MKSSSIGLLLISAAVASPAFAEADSSSEAYQKRYKETYDRVYAERLAENREKLGLQPVAADKKSDTQNVIPEVMEAHPSFYLSAAGVYTRFVSDGLGSDLTGGEIAFGRTFGHTQSGHWGAQLSAGIIKGNIDSLNWGWLTAKEDVTAIPVLASLEYSIHLSKSGNSTFFIGPSVGMVAVKDEISGVYNGRSFNSNASDSAVMAGFNIGTRLNLTGGLDLMISASANYIGMMSFKHTLPSPISTSGSSEADGAAYMIKMGLNYRF